MTKIVKSEGPFGSYLFGMSGSAIELDRFVQWINDGMDFDERPKAPEGGTWTALYVDDIGPIRIDHNDTSAFQYEAPHYAVGSGTVEALVAMHCGKCAAEAVLVASHFQASCGDGVDTLAL